MSKALETTLEIDLRALTHNLNYLKSKLQPQTKFLAVVKAFAYGSDAVEIAKHLETLRVDYFAVAYTQEGISLRDAGIKTPILVLHPQAINAETLIDRCLEPNIYSAKLLNDFITTAEKQGQKNYPIHLKFNTGLNRLGFSHSDVDTVVKRLQSTSAVYVKSIFSHLAASEDLSEKDFTEQQIETFKSIAETFKTKSGIAPWLHLCNTSGILNYPEAHFNMVRSGIGLYGFGNSELEDKNFKPIASLKSVISQIHEIENGESVGYNRAYTSNRNERVATIPIGHADGLSRIYGNKKGFVFINDEKAFIIGNVCMDMIMVDVTDINCKEGDEVVIFDKIYTANEIAESAGTISYEILTALSKRIRRVFLP
ncbi:alanine racemase [Winogradskyella psychrotolerans]|uniref:alanine racemase n=1 Tax=Winogradskyella psychrotolerans TaxID=1344585 RepID=UPI001C0776FA|nr:alanine racemase [Winogradskyella psychrotolerans]MBU2926628.1 alanine racemase [Winogradskyella psychrotolerans]